MIRHMVLFRLKHPAGSNEESAFLDAADALRRIPGVKDFQKSRQVSAKNDYKFVLSMEFDDQAAYSAYNEHPLHVAFVRDRWVPEVEAFLEVDTTPLS
jgi:heme-degrading monooxygenase HmoA